MNLSIKMVKKNNCSTLRNILISLCSLFLENNNSDHFYEDQNNCKKKTNGFLKLGI